jgi:VWFA-related protein
MRSPKLAAAVTSLLAITAMSARASIPDETAAERFRGDTSVTVVEVPVSVTWRGQPVHGLTARDFEVFDRGERREIVGFEILESVVPAVPDNGAEAEVEGKPAGAGGGETPPPHARRHFLFQFDLAYAGTGALSGAVNAAREMLASTLVPGDRVGVVFFSALRGMTWVLGLSDEPADVARALDVMQAVLESDQEAAGKLLQGWDPDPESLVPATSVPDHEAILAEAGMSWLQRNDPSWPHVSTFTELSKGMRRIADGTRDLAGRKHLVQLSNGIPDRLIHNPSLGRPRVLGEIQNVLREFRRTGWTIQSVNLAGLGWGRDSLFVLATDTGGRLYTNSNDVRVLVREMERVTRLTYLLAFQPEDLEANGKYHRLEVKLKERRWGTRVTHRPGYYAPTAP